MASFVSRFLKSLTGQSGGEEKRPAGSDEAVTYKELLIHPVPEREGQQWRIAGTIIKQREDGDWERIFTRADTFTTHEDAVTHSVRKGKQIIDERGPRLFEDGKATGRA